MAKYYRLTITNFGRNGSGNQTYANMAELAFYDESGSNLALLSGASYSANTQMSDQTASVAFDGDKDTYWHSNWSSSPNTTNWLQAYLPTDSEVVSFGITPHTDGSNLDYPIDFKLEVSSDGSSWTILYQGANLADGWAKGVERTFIIDKSQTIYYGGIQLPIIPIEPDYPYCFISISADRYNLTFAKNKYYYRSSDDTFQNNVGPAKNYWLYFDDLAAGDTWSYRNETLYYWADISTRLVWTNYDVPCESADAPDIYFHGTRPTLTKIHLVNSWNASIGNDVSECTLSIDGCVPGNMLILAYAIRGTSNVIKVSNGWTTLGGGNNTDQSSAENPQRIFFAYKIATQENESVTITQAIAKRMYLVCSEYSGVGSIIMRNDLAAIGTSNVSVIGSKAAYEDVMVYGVTSVYYTSGRNQTATPDDLDKIDGDVAAERLACWFDGGLGDKQHTFQTYSSTESYGAVLECVQLIVADAKYLIRSSSVLYTVVDGVLSSLTETDVNAELFNTHGLNTVPDGSLLVDLIDPEVLYWQEDDKVPPELKMSVTGIPPLPQVVITEAYDMSHETILGINSVVATSSEDVLFAVSFDGGTTWHAHNGTQWEELASEEGGMANEIMSSITAEMWAEITTSTYYMFRFVLPNADSYFSSILVDYLN